MARSWRRDSGEARAAFLKAGFRAGASGLALGAAFVSSVAWAQPADTSSDDQAAPATAQTEDENAIIVTGIRASLRNSQQIKRDSDTVVDAITAQDIGALPDRSVTEALQRVPGVAINRFAGSNDPDHFSVEGSGVVIRGLSFVRSEFNGRDTFSTGVYGQAINFSDVPSELLGSVAVYKNLTADMIEGGLSGTVDLRTRLPFDNPGFHIGFDGELNYGDLQREISPTVSLLVSDTWNTGIGRVGLLADFSYSQLLSRSDGIQVTNFQTRDGNYAVAANQTSQQTCRNRLPASTDTTTLPPGGGNRAACDPQTAGADGLADLLSRRAYAPLGGQFRTQDYDRQRYGHRAGGAMGKPRSPRSSDRAVPADRFDLERGASTPSRPRRTFPTTTPIRPAATRTATLRRMPPTSARCARNAGSTGPASSSSPATTGGTDIIRIRAHLSELPVQFR